MDTIKSSTIQDNTQSEDNLHTFKPYDPQLSVPVSEGQRVVKCLYKTNMKTGKAAGENSYIVVPEGHLDESVMINNAAMLAPYMSAYLQSVEDGIIKEFHKGGGKGFSDTFLSLAKILEHLDSAGQGSRLNKEKIGNWFGSEVQDKLIVAFADKLGITGREPTEEETEKLVSITEVYKAKFESLASGKTCYKKEDAEVLQKALEVTQTLDTSLGIRFYNRLESMKTVVANDLLMSL